MSAIRMRPSAGRLGEIHDAVAEAVRTSRLQIGRVATVVTRLEDSGAAPCAPELVTQLVRELVVEAAGAFVAPSEEGNVIVISCRRLASYAVIRIADNATGTPRRAQDLGTLASRAGADLRFEPALAGGGSTATLMIRLADEGF